MNVTFIDTLSYAEQLRAAGFTEQQAAGQAKALAQIIDQNLATKRDLKELELRLGRDLTLRFGGMATATITILGTLIVLFS